MTERDFMEVTVLAVLSRSSNYGYEIVKAIAPLGVNRPPSLIYRYLRSSDANGLVSSEWAAPTLGPRRRIYTITDDGLLRLRELAEQAQAHRTAIAYLLAVIPEGVLPRRVVGL